MHCDGKRRGKDQQLSYAGRVVALRLSLCAIERRDSLQPPFGGVRCRNLSLVYFLPMLKFM